MYAKQRKIKEKLLGELSAKIDREKLYENSFMVVEIEGDFEMNMSGYIASFLVSKYRKPTLVLRKDEKDDKFLVGSMRGYDTLMDDTKDFLQGLNLLEFVEGHQGASGIKIGYDNFSKLDDAINKALYELDTNESHIVDLILPASHLNKTFVANMESYSKIWGKGLEQPKYAIEQLEVNLSDALVMGKDADMIKMSVNGIELVKFSGVGKLKELKLDQDKNIILIDAGQKISASNVKSPKT
jgi:single-stranded-DNA-specific exonuclease